MSGFVHDTSRRFGGSRGEGARPPTLSATVSFVDGFTDRQRRVALALLVAVLAVFGLSAPATAQAPAGEPGTALASAVALVATTPPAPSVAHQHSTPDLPLGKADGTADPAADRTPPAPATDRTPATSGERPRAHRGPAADRAPPARPVTR
jgi:hypothetical protein